MQRSRHFRHAVVAAAASVTLASPCAAGLFLELRAVGATNAVIINDKQVNIVGPSPVVTVGLFVRITGTNGVNDETFNSVYGLFNSVGELLGDLAGGPIAPFRDSAFQNGSVTDWDSDGDLDIGMSPTASSNVGKFFARNSTSMGLPMQTVVDANTSESLISRHTFTPIGVPSGDADIQFTKRNNAGNNYFATILWFEDGSTLSHNGTNSPSIVGAPVHVFVPEPSAGAALSAAGLLLRRRAKSAARAPS